MKAIQLSETGGPELLRLRDIATPEPGAGSALIRVEASGVNFIDVYLREGRYKAPLPLVLGQEGAGTIEALGAGSSGFQIGDRVVWCGVMGSYAELAVVPIDKLIAVPEGLDVKLAAAVLLQGMTAHYLSQSTFELKPGDTALVHAGAGGVGLLLTQMASQAGARVIATVSTPEKAALATEAGADQVVLYTECDFELEVRRLTDGRGVDVVYDSVGKSTFDKSLNCLRPRGLLALFGMSSGPVAPFDLARLATHGSLFVTRPTLVNYTLTREELTARAAEVLGWVQTGKLKVRVAHTYSLADAELAHRDLEGRKTTGKLLLVP